MSATMNDLDKKIITALLINGPLTRQELVVITFTPRTNLYRRLEDLEREGLVIRQRPKKLQKTDGASPVLWTLSQKAKDLSATELTK